MTPENLAAMLTDDELRQRRAELSMDLRAYDRAIATTPPGPDRAAEESAFRAVWRALRVLRAEQERRA
jgi:hypothetical protein